MKKSYDMEVKDINKVNKRINIHLVWYGTKFDEWKFFGGCSISVFFQIPNSEFKIEINMLSNAQAFHFLSKRL